MAEDEISNAPTVPASLRAYRYLVTIKCNKVSYTSRDQIDLVFDLVKRRLPKGYELGMSAYELDSLKRWHFHIIVNMEREPFYKLFQVRGWSIHFQPFDRCDEFKVRSYLDKIPQGCVYLDQLDVESFYYHSHDPFVEDSCAE